MTHTAFLYNFATTVPVMSFMYIDLGSNCNEIYVFLVFNDNWVVVETELCSRYWQAVIYIQSILSP